MVLELELLGLTEKPVDVKDAAENKDLPRRFIHIRKNLRDIYPVVVINFSFRTFQAPQGAQNAGKVTIKFSAYSLNKDEWLMLRKLKKKRDLDDMFAVTNITQETLEQLKDDIEKYTAEEKKEEKKSESSFSGLFEDFLDSFGIKKKKETEEEKGEREKEEKKEEKEESKALGLSKEDEKKADELEASGITPDTFEESVVRDYVEVDSAKKAFTIYDIFKKSMGMASFASPFDEPDVMARIRAKIAEAKELAEYQAREKAKLEKLEK
jgi:hypothetical protein